VTYLDKGCDLCHILYYYTPLYFLKPNPGSGFGSGSGSEAAHKALKSVKKPWLNLKMGTIEQGKTQKFIGYVK